MTGDRSTRRHQTIAALADCSIAGTIFYAVVVHAVRVPAGPAIVVSALAALIGMLILAALIHRGRFNPQAGSLVYSSPSTVGILTVTVGLFAVFTLYNGPIAAAYLPMTATIFGSLLVLSAAKQRTLSPHRDEE